MNPAEPLPTTTEEERSPRVRWRRWIPALLLGLWIAMVKTVEGHIQVEHRPFITPLVPSDALRFLVVLVLATAGTVGICLLLDRVPATMRRWGSPRTWFWGSFALILLVWSWTCLRYFPGVLAPDAFNQMRQMNGTRPWSTDHPILDSGRMWVCIELAKALRGGIAAGVALATAIQAVLVAAGFAYLVSWAVRRGAGVLVAAGLLALLTLDPVTSYMAVTLWKDTPFATVVVLLMTVVWDLVEVPERLKERRYTVALATLFCLLVAFRHNGVLVVALTCVALVWMYRKRALKIAVVAAAVSASLYLLTVPGAQMMGIQPARKVESQGIPLQQVAYTKQAGGTIDPADEAFFDSLLPHDEWISRYDAGTPDPIKFAPTFQMRRFNENVPQFRSAWMRTVATNPDDAAAAWILQTSGYWTTDSRRWVLYQRQTRDYSKNHVPVRNLLTGDTRLSNDPDVQMRAKLVREPALTFWYGLGASVMMVGLWMVVMIRRRATRYLLGLVPLLGVWLSLLIAAPAFCEFRYMMPVHYALPLLAATALFLGRGTPATEVDEPAEEPATAQD